MTPEKERALRALCRLVFVDRLLTLEQAYRCADVCGIPREAIQGNE